MPASSQRLQTESPAPVEDLATALSIAVRIEPELIRAIRLDVFPYYGVAVEADLWFSDLVRSRGSDGIVFEEDVRYRLQGRLAELLSSASLGDPIHRVGGIIARVHDYLSPALLIEEKATWYAICGDMSAVNDALRPALKAVVLERRQGVVQWFMAAQNRLPDAARKSVTAWKIAQASQQQAARAEETFPKIVPAALRTEDLADIVGMLDDTKLLVCRVGTELQIGDLRVGDGVAAIQVPDTNPRLLKVLGVPSAEPKTVSVRRGAVAQVQVGLGTIRLQTARGTVFELPPPVTSTGEDSAIAGDKPDVVPPLDDPHYELVSQLIQGGELVVLLGSRLTAPRAEWSEGSGLLPNAEELAAELARRARMESTRLGLPAVAQYVRMVRGRADLHRWLRQILNADNEPGPVYRFLARFPRTLEELGLERRYPLIVSANFDGVLERAFDEEQEPYDLVIYMASGPDQGKFVHFPFEGPPVPISSPNSYTGFPISELGDLFRTVIVKIHGSADGSIGDYVWKGNYVITEDDYIDYLSGSSVESLVPVQLLDKLRESHCLFLGYAMRDWTQRVFLRRIWQGGVLRAQSWAVGQDLDVLEKVFWTQAHVDLYSADPAEYVAQMREYLAVRSGQSVPGRTVTGGIFISYRRVEAARPALVLAGRLTEHFGQDRIFMDIESTQPGDDFAEVINGAIGSCEVLLALIGDRWLTVADADGRRALDDPEDSVRLEIEAALRRDIPVIPVLVGGAGMPRANELPPSLAPLVLRQAVELSPTRIDKGIERLIMVLDRMLG